MPLLGTWNMGWLIVPFAAVALVATFKGVEIDGKQVGENVQLFEVRP